MGKVPNQDELDDRVKLAATLSGCFQEVTEEWEKVPSEDELSDRPKEAASLAGCLQDAAK